VKVKSLVVSVAGGLALLGAQASFACSLAAWGQGNPPGGAGTVGAPLAGEPDDVPTPVKRYSQRCGLQATAANNYVQDGLPTNEARVTGRLYFFSGAASGSGSIYQLESGGATPTTLLNLSYDADNDQLDIAVNGGPATGMNGMVQDRWWVITFDWNTATNNVTVNARGNGSATGLTQAVVGGVLAADRAETSKVGHIAGAFTGGQGRFWDAVEFRRTTVPAELCRGNANPSDQTRNVLDLIAMVSEINSQSLSAGQPDFNEDGTVNVLDLIGTVAVINSPTPQC
jgi:hypothetical protein